VSPISHRFAAWETEDRSWVDEACPLVPNLSGANTEENSMSELRYRIGTVAFSRESRPTWGTRSEQVLEALAGWAREGWKISRLNGASRVALGCQGFCILLEREAEDRERKVARFIRA
jgi:hypothetical protein